MKLFTEDNSTLKENDFILKNINNNRPIHYGESLIYIEPIVNRFHAILALDKDKKIIRNSNSFLTDPFMIKLYTSNPEEIKFYDLNQTIYTRLQKTYDYLLTAEPEIVVEEQMFLLLNSFSSVNFGHDLSILFDRINTYRSLNLNIPVVVGDCMYHIPRSLEILKMFFPDTQLYYLPSNTTVLFKDLIITENIVFDILKNKDIIDELIKKCNDSNNDDKYKGKKIFIVKNFNNNKNILTKYTAFNCSKTMDILTTKLNYICINPEEMPMRDIILYLNNASKIVTSYGAILYGNGLFFNKNAEMYFMNTLETEGTLPYYDVDLYTQIFSINSNIDDVIDAFLENINETL